MNSGSELSEATLRVVHAVLTADMAAHGLVKKDGGSGDHVYDDPLLWGELWLPRHNGN